MKTKSKFLRILSLVSALAVLVACNTLFSSVSAAETSNVWDGTTATEPDGTGIEANPYLIANGENLRWLLNQITSKAYSTVGTFESAPTFGKFYKLTNDIYLNDVSSENWYEGGKAHSWDYGIKDTSKVANYPFLGTLDGDGHTINGLYCNSDAQYVSLFPAIGTNAVVKNLKIANSYIKTTSDTNTGAAALFATTGGHWDSDVSAKTEFAVTPVITKCAVEESVIVNAPRRAAAFIVNVDGTLEISDCLSAADVSVENTTSGKGKLAAGFAAHVLWSGKTGFFDLKNSLVVNENGLVPCNSNAATNLKLVPVTINGKEYQNLNNVYMLKNDSDYTSGYGKTIYEKTQLIDSIALIQGDAAESTLKGFNFDNTWQSVQDDTPTLLFPKAEINKHKNVKVQKDGIKYAKGTLCYGADFKALKAYLNKENFDGEVEIGFVLSTAKALGTSELNLAAVESGKAKNVSKTFSASELPDNLYCILKAPASHIDTETNTITGAYLTATQYARAYVKYGDVTLYADTASAVANDLLNK